MSGWKETAAMADEVQRATLALINECNRQKCAEMLAHEETKKELGHALLKLDKQHKISEELAAHYSATALELGRAEQHMQSFIERSAQLATENLRLAKENDLMRQLLQVAVLSLPNDEETELLRKRICALGGRRG